MPDDLIKCDDMNALLWYMINRANKRYVWKPTKYRHDDEFRPDYPRVDGGYEKQNTEDKERMQKIYHDEPLAKLEKELKDKKITQEEFDTKKSELKEKWAAFQANFNEKLKNVVFQLCQMI